jgi:hypothetical protein
MRFQSGGEAMSSRFRVVCVAFLLGTLLAAAAAPRTAGAGVSESVLALAAPLAGQFGVPVSAVTSLLQSGISLESATQLLLVTQSSQAKLDEVTELYRGYGNDITKTAEKLDVDPSAYSKEKVTATIDQAKASAVADAKQKATDEAGKAVGNATDEASKAVGDALGGLRR